MKILQKEITGTQTSFSNQFGGKLSFILCFLFLCTAATYIFTAPSCTTTIITLERCALKAEFQHFTPRFDKISLLCRYHWKIGDRGRKQRRYRVKQRVTLPITLLSAEHCAKKSANIQRFDTHPILCFSHKKIDAHPKCYFVSTKFNTHKIIRPLYLGQIWQSIVEYLIH